MGYYTTLELDPANVSWYAHYLTNNVSSEDSEKFMLDVERSEFLALYLMNNNYCHRDHMVESMVLEAMANHTIFNGDICLRSALKNESKGKHVIKINNSCYEDFVSLWDVDAYHISSGDLNVLEKIVQMENKYCDKSEGAEYELVIFDTCDQIKIRNCYAGEFISANIEINGNRYSEDCDTYALSFGSKAQEAYFFWVEDIGKYAVVYFSYWCV